MYKIPRSVLCSIALDFLKLTTVVVKIGTPGENRLVTVVDDNGTVMNAGVVVSVDADYYEAADYYKGLIESLEPVILVLVIDETIEQVWGWDRRWNWVIAYDSP